MNRPEHKWMALVILATALLAVIAGIGKAFGWW